MRRQVVNCDSICTWDSKIELIIRIGNPSSCLVDERRDELMGKELRLRVVKIQKSEL